MRPSVQAKKRAERALDRDGPVVHRSAIGGGNQLGRPDPPACYRFWPVG